MGCLSDTLAHVSGSDRLLGLSLPLCCIGRCILSTVGFPDMASYSYANEGTCSADWELNPGADAVSKVEAEKQAARPEGASPIAPDHV